jgi:hypothetical protein
MSNLGNLFGKASQITQPSSPAPAEALPPAKPAGFKIGGFKPAPTAAPSDAAPQAKPTESVPQVPLSPEPELAAPTPAFPDQTPATAPQRSLPEDISEAAARFVSNLDHLHTLTPEPELATAAISSIMIELRSNPQYINHIMPEDVRVIIQMQRETMALAKITKEKKVSKRSPKVKEDTARVLKDLEDAFGDL